MQFSKPKPGLRRTLLVALVLSALGLLVSQIGHSTPDQLVRWPTAGADDHDG